MRPRPGLPDARFAVTGPRGLNLVFQCPLGVQQADAPAQEIYRLLAGAGDPVPVSLCWHLGPEISCQLGGRSAFLSWTGGQASLSLPSELDWKVYRGDDALPAGWYSPAFDRKLPSVTLTGSALVALAGRGPARLVGIDPSELMARMAAARLDGLGTVHRASLETMRFAEASFDAALMLTWQDMLASLEQPGIVKLDVRDRDEWIGVSSSPYGKDFTPRKGRIPGAVWLEWYRLMRADSDIPMFIEPEEILKACAERSTDLLVAGAYGHTRWREVIFGGVTKSLIADKAGPSLFLSH